MQQYPAASDLHRLPPTPTLTHGGSLAPGNRLVSTVAFSATVPGRLLFPAPVLIWQSHLLRRYPVTLYQVRPVTSRSKLSSYKPIFPWFPLPLLRTSQRSLMLKIGRQHALWPGACQRKIVINWEVILVDIKGSKVRTPKSSFWLSMHALSKSSQN